MYLVIIIGHLLELQTNDEQQLTKNILKLNPATLHNGL